MPLFDRIQDSLFDKFHTIFSPENVSYTANISQITGVSLTAIIALSIQKLSARAKKEKEPHHDNEKLDRIGGALSRDAKFISNVQIVTRILRDDNVDSMEIYTLGGQVCVSINPEQAYAIASFADKGKDKKVYIERCVVQVDTPHLERPLELMWRFRSSKFDVFNARLLDREFAEHVLRGRVSFSHGQQFMAKLRIEEYSDRCLYEVVELEEYGGQQMEIPRE